MNTPDYSKLNSSTSRETCIRIHYPEFYRYLVDKYPNDLTFSERMYWYFNNIVDYPICPVCGKRLKFYRPSVGYQQFCSTKCSNSSETKKNKTVTTNIKRYGGTAPACSDKVRAKIKSTNLERYGVENISQSKEYYKKNIQTRVEKYGGCGNASKVSKDKYELTCLKKYGTKNPMSSKEFRESHNIVSPFTKPEIREKCKRTAIKNHNGMYSEDYKGSTSCPEVLNFIYWKKKQNHTFNTSNIEKRFEDYLKSKGVRYQTQYRSDQYPFNCDFYIEDLELYVELQSSWTHGEHPYNEEQDKEKLKLWIEKSKTSKFYKNAIRTWTVRDTIKRQTAKRNNLKYLEIFTNNINIAVEEYERFVSRL